ncbi:MAG: hypothetical protein QOF58_5674 [Pseudonocardiales bacterium]|nr:hypothetical protein [Pseudonocardiales bacterium]
MVVVATADDEVLMGLPLGNPDLVERFRLGLPLVSTDRETWFQTEAGYVDHLSYQQ